MNVKERRDSSADRWEDLTPKNDGWYTEAEREREKEFLESLRSPGLGIEEEDEEETDGDGVSGGEDGGVAGGWGLGRGQHSYRDEEEDLEESVQNDWQAQGVVERMVGLR